MKKVGMTFRIILICLLLLVLAINISVIIQAKTNENEVPKILGVKPFVVLSGSMNPEIEVGDLVLVKDVDTNTLKEGDIIAYRDSGDKVTTHRIVEVIKEDGNLSFITKGDANNANDEQISASQVEGKYQKRFPKLGHAVMFLQQPLGFAVVVLSIFIVCMLLFIMQNRKLNKEIKFENDKKKRAFEEFKKSRNNN